MTATVLVNDRTVVHQSSGGVSVAFPDVCLVPSVGPVPFINVAQSLDAEDVSDTVYADGLGVMLKDSCFSKSVGDEAGTDGGLISGRWNGKASFTNYSFDVLIEGRNVARLHDPMGQNHGSPHNTTGPSEVQEKPDGSALDLTKELLCSIFCECDAMGLRTECCTEQLAEKRERYDKPAGRRTYWDPKVPGIYVEVPFDMSKNPPQPMMDKEYDRVTPGERSRFIRDPAEPDKGMPLPGGDWPPVDKSKRPDVVKVKDPGLPIDAPGNIDAVYDFKFPGDVWQPGQRKAYEDIAPRHVYEISEEECDCPNPRSRSPRPVPVPVDNPVPDDGKEKRRKDPDPVTVPIGVGVLAVIAAILRIIAAPMLPSPAIIPLAPGSGPHEA